MKKFLKISLSCCIILMFVGYASKASAAPFDDIVTILSKGSTQEALEKYFYFDGTTLWIMIASFFLSIGMIGLASEMGSHFAHVPPGSPAGQMAFRGAAFTAGSALVLGGKATKGLAGIVKESGKAKKNESTVPTGQDNSQKASRVNSYEGGNSDSGSSSGSGSGSSDSSGGLGSSETKADEPDPSDESSEPRHSHHSHLDPAMHIPGNRSPFPSLGGFVPPPGSSDFGGSGGPDGGSGGHGGGF